MEDKERTKNQLIRELSRLRQRIAELEESENDRKQAEEKLREHSDRLEEMFEERTKELRDAHEKLMHREKLTVLGQLAGGVGHELRNPLGTIKNAAYFLNMALEKPDKDVKETLDLLKNEAAASERIISSLLDFARPKPPMRQKVNVNNLFDEVLTRNQIPKNIKIMKKLSKTLPTIMADPDQLTHVFRNIILNGIQAMPEGGKLVIASRVSNPEWIAVSIDDNGIGISKDILGKLFEPLFTAKTKGVGLGLAVTKILVEGHGGTIEVESEEGKGSTFTVRLPRASKS